LILLIIAVSSLTGVTSVFGIFIDPPDYDGYITCSGYIKNLQNEPLAGAWVQLLDSYGREIGSFEFTSSNGHYTITGRAARQYIEVKTSAGGLSSSVLKRAPGTYTVNFYLDIPSEPVVEENKIAYFLYNNDAGPKTITDFGDSLYDRGITDITYKNFDEIEES